MCVVLSTTTDFCTEGCDLLGTNHQFKQCHVQKTKPEEPKLPNAICMASMGAACRGKKGGCQQDSIYLWSKFIPSRIHGPHHCRTPPPPAPKKRRRGAAHLHRSAPRLFFLTPPPPFWGAGGWQLMLKPHRALAVSAGQSASVPRIRFQRAGFWIHEPPKTKHLPRSPRHSPLYWAQLENPASAPQRRLWYDLPREYEGRNLRQESIVRGIQRGLNE